MTVGLASGAANAMLDDQFDGTPTLKIHTGDPGAAGTSNVSAGDNTAKAVTFAAASAGSKVMNGTDPVWTNGGTSETLTHVSHYKAGTFKCSFALTASKAWASTDTFTLTDLSVALTPIAA
jgi:hypothetical protein